MLLSMEDKQCPFLLHFSFQNRMRLNICKHLGMKILTKSLLCLALLGSTFIRDLRINSLTSIWRQSKLGIHAVILVVR